MKVHAKTLTELAKPGGGSRRARAPKCRTCLAPEEIVMVGKAPYRKTQSTLLNGVCRDSQACNSRAPALFGDDT